MNWFEWTTLVIVLSGLMTWLRAAQKIMPSLLRPRRLSRIEESKLSWTSDAPLVSVIVPACNEAETIARCLESLAKQDYPNLEIVAINDRSTDATGRIIDDVSVRYARIKVLHIETLPSGWLGKNHANYMGVGQSRGKWLLFTDGDIIFQTDAISRSVAHAEAEALDHLCLMPGLISHGFWETAMCCFFGVLFSLRFEPWNVRNPSELNSYCGIGAFNLVRRTAYMAIGTHEKLRLEVADDVKLGKLLKHAGKICDAMAGWPQIKVRWQVGLRGVVRGLEKNGFCGGDFKVWKTTWGCFQLFVVATLPVAGSIFCTDTARWLSIIWLLTEMAMLSLAARRQGYSIAIGLSFPIAALTLVYAVMRSMCLALWRGGIRWRGTFYPLDELRRGLV